MTKEEAKALATVDPQCWATVYADGGREIDTGPVPGYEDIPREESRWYVCPHGWRLESVWRQQDCAACAEAARWEIA